MVTRVVEKLAPLLATLPDWDDVSENDQFEVHGLLLRGQPHQLKLVTNGLCLEFLLEEVVSLEAMDGSNEEENAWQSLSGWV